VGGIEAGEIEYAKIKIKIEMEMEMGIGGGGGGVCPFAPAWLFTSST
jgi:hypothetical protein